MDNYSRKMTIPEDIIIDALSISITVGVFIITQYFPILTMLEPFMLYDTLDRIITYPHTNSLKNNSKNNKVVNEQMINNIKNDIDYKVSGNAKEISAIMDGLIKWKEAFMTDSMDRIIITKCGIEVLHIRYSLKGSGRSIAIDLVKYKDEILSKRAFLSYALTLITAIIVSSRNLRSVL